MKFGFRVSSLTLALWVGAHLDAAAPAARDPRAVDLLPATAPVTTSTLADTPSVDPPAAHADASDWVQFGDALMQQSRESLDPKLYARAEQAYQRALELEPKCIQALLGLAWVHNTEHEFDAGERFARAALAVNPELPEPHALLGDAAVELGDYDTAFEHYQKALDLRPDLSSYSRAAHLLWLTGDAVKARWLMQKAIDAGGPYPENRAWCRAQLALILLQTGALLPAEQEIASALKEAPRNPHVLAAAGRIKTRRDEYSAAIEFYEKSIAAAPTHDALAALVDLYELAGRPEEAQRQFDRVVAFHEAHHSHVHGDLQDHSEHTHGGSSASPAHEHDHEHPHGNYQLARFYADHDRNLAEALQEAKAGWKAFPNVYAADALAWCLYKNGEFTQAAKMIGRALRYGTPDAAFHFHAGMIYAKLENRPLAQKHLYQALSLNPHFHPTQAQLAADTIKHLSTRAE
jgi:tetratricopeptide (TPR) repeat protein